VNTDDTADAAALGDPGRAARLGKRLSDHDDRAMAAQSVVAAAVATVGCSWAAVAHRTSSTTVHEAVTANDDVATTVADVVADTREGVGPAVLAERGTVLVTDLAADERWPRYRAEVLRRTPVRSIVGFYLELGGDEVGALLLFDHRPDFFTADVVRQAAVFADLATIALARSSDRERAANLHRALATNRVIGQALGIIMARESLTADAAWSRLREVSMRRHRRVQELAEDIAYTGEFSDA
jgi:GAF domain-containing protein